ncbi:MAG: DoxX family protein [Sphingobacteriales bacterium]|nr:MAG: DoxX family protein [Sphingobacteriales bacterium]
MKKSHKIIYWISTIWLAVAMLASGVQQVFQMKSFADIVIPLGYPMYFLTILGVWKIHGAIVILLPRFPLFKEWAYAGFFFAMSGAAISHIAKNNFPGAMPSIILLVMVVVSWYFRSVDKKIPVAVQV